MVLFKSSSTHDNTRSKSREAGTILESEGTVSGVGEGGQAGGQGGRREHCWGARLEGRWPRGEEQWRRLMIKIPAIPGHKG